MSIDAMPERLSQVLAAQFLAHGRSVAAASPPGGPPREQFLPKLSPDPANPDRGLLSRHRGIVGACRTLDNAGEPSLLVVWVNQSPDRPALERALSDPSLLLVVASCVRQLYDNAQQYHEDRPPVYEEATLTAFRRPGHYVLSIDRASAQSFVPVGPVGDGTLKRMPLPGPSPSSGPPDYSNRRP